MADGGEMTTIDGTPVNFIIENEAPVQSIIESSGNNTVNTSKINQVVDSIQESEEGIIIQTVDTNDANITNLEDGTNQSTEEEQLNKNWLYIDSSSQPLEEDVSSFSSTLIQASERPEDYKLTLLQQMFANERIKSFLDLVVFCCDGVTWTSKLLMSASSIMVRDAFSQLDNLQNETTCIVLPDISKVEFCIFQESLFAPARDINQGDLIVVIKVAETLGVDLPIQTSLPNRTESSREVNYKVAQEDSNEWKRVLSALGYETSLFNTDGGSKYVKNNLESGIMSKLVSIFDTNVSCEKCHRKFANETSLKKHITTVHNHKNSSSNLNQKYDCGKCDQRFAFAINVRKHQWLCHRKGIKHILRINNFDNEAEETKRNNVGLRNDNNSEFLDGHLDKGARRKKALQEKMEDMTCKDCGLKCTSWKQLQIHTMDHSNERPFKCKLCQKGFKEPQKLKRHMVSHTREKKFSCKYCKKSFGLKHNMKTHEKIHEGGGHHCSYCDRTFSQSNTLQDHEVKHRKLRHVKTQDENIRTRQLLKAVRGRPSLKESFAKQGKNILDIVTETDKATDKESKVTTYALTKNLKNTIESNI